MNISDSVLLLIPAADTNVLLVSLLITCTSECFFVCVALRVFWDRDGTSLHFPTWQFVFGIDDRDQASKESVTTFQWVKQ